MWRKVEIREYRRCFEGYDFRQPGQQGDDDLDLCFSSDGFFFQYLSASGRGILQLI